MTEKEINGFMIVDEPDEDVPRLERKIVKKKLIKSDNLSENKRFTWEVIDGDPLFYDDDAMIDYDDVVDLLNELSEENSQYKILTDELKRQNKKLKARLEDLGVEYYD